MSLNSDIEDIKSKLKSGSYQNEAAVSQGIILRLLNSLGWPIFDSLRVSPEYTIGTGRVDYALCHPPGKPIILIESKDVGSAYGGEKQLFEYAFHQGIPMAVLTDGQEWSFFLPGEQGAYHERCVYKLDLIARSTEECFRVFDRYLNYEQVISGNAITNAKNDYKDVSRQRQIEIALPEAWKVLIKEQDEILVELIADKVETLCGFKPEPDVVRKYLDSLLQSSQLISPTGNKPHQDKSLKPSEESNDFSGFIFDGQSYQEGSAIGTMIRVFKVLSQKYPSFFERYARLPKHGRKRRYLARNKMDLYPGRPDLCEQYSEQIASDWWVGTNYSRSTIRHAIELACEVAGIQFGSNLRLR
jgi:hypothetical protein